MKTSHLTSITTRINPFSPSSKIPRLILQLLGPKAQRTVQIKNTQLPRTSTQSSLLELGFKDGKTMKWEWGVAEQSGLKRVPGQKMEGESGLQDIVEEVNRHTRVLSRKEELSN